jgi:hypothetical protein
VPLAKLGETCFLLKSGCPLCLCRESLERVEAASAGFRDLSFPFCGSCPPLVLACKLVSPVQTYFSFFNKAGSYGLLSKKVCRHAAPDWYPSPPLFAA